MQGWGGLVTNTPTTKWTDYCNPAMAFLCWTVSYSNHWRFSNIISIEGGGSAFILPSFVLTVLLIIPLTYMELAMGQYSNKGPATVWSMCLVMRGITWSGMFVLTWIALGYGVLCSYVFHYTIASFQSELPWLHCGHNSESLNCFTLEQNISFRLLCTRRRSEQDCSKLTWENSAAHYWNQNILKKEGGLIKFQWQLYLLHLVILLFIFVSLRGGVKTVQAIMKFLCFVPYLEVGILLYVSFTHPGSFEGLRYLIKPGRFELTSYEAWSAALENNLLNVGIGLGGLTMLGSLCSFRNPVHINAIIINAKDFLGLAISAIIIFNALGALSYAQNIKMEEILAWPHTILFVTLPLCFAVWPGSTNLWTIMFFSSMLLMGIRTYMFQIAILTSVFWDKASRFYKYRQISIAITCITLFVLSTPFYIERGLIVLSYIDQIISCGALTLVVIFETIGVMWLYSIKQFTDDLHFMLGFRVSAFWQLIWLTAPIILGVFFCYSVYIWNHEEDDERHAPWVWLYILQWVLLLTPLVIIIHFACHFIIKADYKKLLRSSSSWGPSDPILRRSRETFSLYSMTKEYLYRQNRLRTNKFQAEVPVVLEGEHSESESR